MRLNNLFVLERCKLVIFVVPLCISMLVISFSSMTLRFEFDKLSIVLRDNRQQLLSSI